MKPLYSSIEVFKQFLICDIFPEFFSRCSFFIDLISFVILSVKSLSERMFISFFWNTVQKIKPKK